MSQDVRTRSVIFEATFIKPFEPLDDAFVAALRQAGFDPHNMQVSYPNSVFNACLDAAHRTKLPTLTPEKAYWALGRGMTRGFAQTLLGKVVVTGFSLLGPMRLLRKYPSTLSMDDTDVRMTFEEKGKQHAVLHVTYGAPTRPEFTAGIVEAGLEMAKAKPTVTLNNLRPGAYDIEVTWTE